MTNETEDGGPAFPVDTNNQFPTQAGMSLRDYFAAKAMQGILSSQQNEKLASTFVAEWAYDIANAMIKAQEQNGETKI